ncbi:flavin reductase family protein [Psychrobacter alimentarius]|uniref:flavin reductase family protein n=1 Tax=Psychrobacter alimentarius TaxID=261164 RepID=UPI0019196E19|nr:iron-sulfur cluster-binding domain-containing protein [Psychrobacter alimentarius]
MATGYRPEWVQGAFVDFIESRLHPFWSLSIPKIRLLARHRLSDDLIALQFETNRAFRQRAFSTQKGWHGGQYLNVSVVLAGICHQRSYSLVGLPHQPLWWIDDSSNAKTGKNLPSHTVTVAIKPQGLVSDYLTKRMPIGTAIHSSIPTGSFTLAQAALAQKYLTKEPEHNQLTPLLFIASGSGITPMLGLITEALRSGHQVTLLHYNRTILLQSQWQTLAATYPDFTYHLIDTEDSNTHLAGTRHLTADSLLTLNLSWAETQIFACGSQALLTSLYNAADQIPLPDDKSLRDNIVVESFGTSFVNATDEQTLDEASTQTVYLRARQRQFSSDTTLLTAAEKAGIRLTHGCRQGICQLCRCQKISGVVKNIQTGKLSHDGHEFIQTCINVAVTDVVLDV